MVCRYGWAGLAGVLKIAKCFAKVSIATEIVESSTYSHRNKYVGRYT